MISESVELFYNVIARRYFERDSELFTAELYEDYVLFCELRGFEPASHKELSQSWREFDIRIVFKRTSKGIFYKEDNKDE